MHVATNQVTVVLGPRGAGELRGLRPGGRRTRPRRGGRAPVVQSPDAAIPTRAGARGYKQEKRGEQAAVSVTGGAPDESEASKAGPAGPMCGDPSTRRSSHGVNRGENMYRGGRN